MAFCVPQQTIQVICDVNLLDALNFTTDVYINLCAKPVNINITFIPPNWSTVIDTSLDIPVPGLSVDIPEIGDAGVFIDVALDSSPSNVTLVVGIDACIGILDYQECEPDV